MSLTNEQIIEAIYHRFPDTGMLSPNTAQPSALITLGLEVVPSVEVSRNSSAPGV